MSSGGPKGINWEAALEYYLAPKEDGRMPSYQDVANKFDVSKKEVGLRARRENWLYRRQNVYDQAEEEFVEDRVALIKNTTERHIKHWKTIQNTVGNLLDNLYEEPKITGQILKNLAQVTNISKTVIEGERTALGLPNTIDSSHYQSVVEKRCEFPQEEIDEIDKFAQDDEE
jgi:hypothetical protein